MKLKEQLAIEYINSSKYYKSGSYPSDTNVMEAYVAGFEKCREMANQGFLDMLDGREGGSFGTNDILELGEEEAK